MCVQKEMMVRMPTILNVRVIMVLLFQMVLLREHYRVMINLRVERTAFSTVIAVAFKEPRIVLLAIR